MERTLVLVKPDGVQRGLAGGVIARLEAKGLRLAAVKMVQISQALARQHYAAHQGKGFFPGLVEFITSGPVVAIVVAGPDAIEVVRRLMGATNPLEAEPGTIRGDWGLSIGRNVIHGSDSPEAAEREIGLFFTPAEVLDYPRSLEPWITES